ncbi:MULTISPECIES: chlorhexidine efflux transporter [Shewanella]|uniref:chlorhexidine efflux transporter n=1 Tax=Shewanella TaxID=22 RepID=UPI003006BB95
MYNLGFKRFYGNNPDACGIGLRLLHTLGGEGRLILVTVPAITWALETSLLNAFFIEAGILGASYSTTPCLTGSITACGARPSAHQGVLLKGNYYVGDFCCSSNSLPQMLVYLG